jgi:hypothetical protein
MDGEVSGCAPYTADLERESSGWLDREVNESRLVTWNNIGDLRLRRGRKNVEQEIWRKAVRYVWRKVQVLYGQLSICCPGGDLPGIRVDQDINRLWKRT